MEISLQFVWMNPIENESSICQVIAWEPKQIQFTDIYNIKNELTETKANYSDSKTWC